MLTLVTLWWLLFFTALGLCLGSFLNAVIYRLPRNRSLRHPLWSFCPSCKHRIHWYDNLPVISFLLLRGRCRYCGVPISTRYPVIEVSMALIVLMLLDAFFIGRVRSGLSDSLFGLTDGLSHDWPILAVHVILFACLLPMSAIDLEHYWVDVRFTNFATITGFTLHSLWTPPHSSEWIRPFDTTAVVSLFALVGLGIVWVVRARRRSAAVEGLAPLDRESVLGPSEGAENPEVLPDSAQQRGSLAAGWVAGFVLVGMSAALLVEESGVRELPHMGRALLPLLLLLGLILWASTVERSSDHQVAEAIRQERHLARRMVLSEFVLLVPALLAAAVGLGIMTYTSELPGKIGEIMHGRIYRGYSPLYGLATAASGYVIAGALGWSIRIVFTLLFGREAFGSGDIHLMAATGCVAGWPVVLLGFFLTCVLAMTGWVLALPFKRTRAVPLGPWLALSFLAVVVFYDRVVEWSVVSRGIEVARWLIFNNSQVPILDYVR